MSAKLSLVPAKVDIDTFKGGTLDVVLTCFELDAQGKPDTSSPLDLTGYTARMVISQGMVNFTTVDTLTTENGRIILGGSAGTVRLMSEAETTDGYTFVGGNYSLALIDAAGFVRYIIAGAYLARDRQ